MIFSEDKKSSDAYFHWIAYTFGTVAYMISMFHKVEIAVLVPYIIDTYKASSSALGFLSGIYFYVYALSQPFVGAIGGKLDKKNMLLISLLLISLGTFMFAYAPMIIFLYIGRFLVGIGSAGIFIPCNLIINDYFKFNEKGFLLFILQFAGNAGTVLAVSPLVYLVSILNWRGSLTFIGMVSVILGLVVWIFVRGDNAFLIDNDRNNISANKIQKNWFFVIKNVLFKIPVIKYCIISSSSLAALISFQSLWVVSYLMNVYYLNEKQASYYATMIPTGFIIGLLLFSKLSDNKIGKLIYFYSTIVVSIISVVLLIFTNNLPEKLIPYLFLLFGFCRSTGPYVFKIYTLVIPIEYYSKSLGILNMFPYISIAIFQTITGLLFGIINKKNVLSQYIFSYRIYFFLQSIIAILAAWSIFNIIEILKEKYPLQI